MARIKSSSRFQISRARGYTGEIRIGVDAKIFLRHMRQGLVVVRSYVEDGSLVEMVRDGYTWWRWYDYTPITARQAALLVNRFIADMSDPASIE